METVLVVDDNEQNCELIRDIVSTWGYEVYKAFQGKDAIKIALNSPPDIILLDVMLPGMNGFEVCHELKNNLLTQNVPIVMLTVLTDVDDRIHGLKVGADNFLVKPFNYHELKYIMASLITRKKVIDKMEHQNCIVDSFLEMIKMRNQELLEHVLKVHAYCEKVAMYMELNETQKEKLLVAAYLHDIGYIVESEFQKHACLGAKFIAPYKIGDWLTVLIKYHHEKMNNARYPIDILNKKNVQREMEVLLTINRFVDLWNESDQESAVARAYEEGTAGEISLPVVKVLQQIIKDEKFRVNFGEKQSLLGVNI